MAYSADDLAKMQAAIVTGVKTIHFDGPPARTVTFQDSDAIARVLAQARADASALATPRRFRYIKTKRGFDP